MPRKTKAVLYYVSHFIYLRYYIWRNPGSSSAAHFTCTIYLMCHTLLVSPSFMVHIKSPNTGFLTQRINQFCNYNLASRVIL